MMKQLMPMNMTAHLTKPGLQDQKKIQMMRWSKLIGTTSLI